MSNKTYIKLSIPEIIIQSFEYNTYQNKIWITEKAEMVFKTFYVRRE